jgi:hypothetical protein
MESHIVFKRVGKYIIEMYIPDDAITTEKRNTVDKFRSKFRTNKAFILSIYHDTTNEHIDSIINKKGIYKTLFFGVNITRNIPEDFEYEVGKMITTPFDNPDSICGNGIHYFLSKEAAIGFSNLGSTSADDRITKFYSNNGEFIFSLNNENVKRGINISIRNELISKYLHYCNQIRLDDIRLAKFECGVHLTL